MDQAAPAPAPAVCTCVSKRGRHARLCPMFKPTVKRTIYAAPVLPDLTVASTWREFLTKVVAPDAQEVRAERNTAAREYIRANGGITPTHLLVLSGAPATELQKYVRLVRAHLLGKIAAGWAAAGRPLSSIDTVAILDAITIRYIIDLLACGPADLDKPVIDKIIPVLEADLGFIGLYWNRYA